MKLELENFELLLTFENVQLIDRATSKPKAIGSLHLLSSHLVFIDSTTKRQIWIYYSLVASVERLPLNTLGFPLLVKCKHFLTCQFSISKERDCQSICATVMRFSRPPKVQELLCFQENKQLAYLKPIKLNHSMFNLESEYARMGVPNNEWSLTDLNLTYELCSTYPTHLYAPSRASKAVLQASALFRSRGRLPVLSYLHSNGASICRCAQPLTGLNARSNEDEQLMQLILETNPNAGVMYVVDTRPKINAMANKAQGKGYENENNYANTQFYFIGIENIHVMRDSLQKLTQCTDSTTSSSINQFLYSLEKCDWLKHIKAVIDTSIFIVEAIGSQNISVVVHCSDGWDRTSQVCALAALLLDPYYRTIHGFQVLIEKDWLMFGHKFTHRLGHVFESEAVAKEVSPVFAQFLECIWQIAQQFPCAFEFNERFLIKLHEHCYSCQFGTFVGNCQKEREELKLKDLTYSYWDYVQYKLNEFINPLYVPNSVYSREILKPDTRPQNFNFWTGLYNRFEANVNVNEKMYDILNIIKNKTTALNDYAKQLEKRQAQLKAMLGQSNDQAASVEPQADTKSVTDMMESLSTRSESIESAAPSTNGAKINIDELTNDLNAISLLTWKSLRRSCWCYDTNDYASSKSNCSKCGNLFCDICMEDGGGFADTTKKFVCKKCCKA